MSFEPVFWYRHPHVQTVFAGKFRRAPIVQYDKERLELPDGDFLDLFWTQKPQREGALVVLLHGVAGSAQSPYIRAMASVLASEGFGVASLNFRGAGEINRKVEAYHAGEIKDLEYVLEQLREKHPHTSIFAIGFSLGGSILLNHLGRSASVLSGAIAVSVPVDLTSTAKKLQREFFGIYDRFIVRSLRRMAKEKWFFLEGMGFSKEVLKARTVWEFDDKITAPIFGFENAQDYYQQCSSKLVLSQIAVPTLLLQSKDDPFLDIPSFPKPDQVSSAVTCLYTQYGGHVGFVRSPLRFGSYVEEQAVQFINDLLIKVKAHQKIEC